MHTIHIPTPCTALERSTKSARFDERKIVLPHQDKHIL
jgi:hypothetical protein